jgi:hypothetical protein
MPPLSAPLSPAFICFVADPRTQSHINCIGAYKGTGYRSRSAFSIQKSCTGVRYKFLNRSSFSESSVFQYVRQKDRGLQAVLPRAQKAFVSCAGGGRREDHVPRKACSTFFHIKNVITHKLKHQIKFRLHH